MELKRILAKDSRTAMDIAMARYGKDVLVVSSQSVAGQVELVVALDVQPEPAPAPVAAPAASSAFTQAFRRALGPMPEPQPEPDDEPAASVMARRMPSAAAASLAMPAAAAPAVIPLPRTPVRPTAPARAAMPMQAAAAAPAAAPEGAATAAGARGKQMVDLVRRELAALRQEIDTGRQVRAWQGTRQWPAAVAAVIDALSEAGVPAGLRALLTQGLESATDAGQALMSMRAQLAGGFSGLQPVAIDRGFHAICGPSGAGKTHMVTRLARAAALRLGAQRVAIVAFNDQRCGAWSQTRVLAAQAGVACYRAGDASSLRMLLDELGDQGLVLIDTAGIDCQAQAEALRTLDASIATHLLLPADASIGSVKRLLAAGHEWRSLMVGKVDECSSPWPVLQALTERGLPVSFSSASGDVQVSARPLDAQRLVAIGFDQLLAELQPESAQDEDSVDDDIADSVDLVLADPVARAPGVRGASLS